MFHILTVWPAKVRISSYSFTKFNYDGFVLGGGALLSDSSTVCSLDNVYRIDSDIDDVTIW